MCYKFVPHCVVVGVAQEVKTTNALSVLQYSCSARTMALHTGELNARRCATTPFPGPRRSQPFVVADAHS